MNNDNLTWNWKKVFHIYPYYPTVRHRQRYILNALNKYNFNSDTFIFDYGLGDGHLLEILKNKYKLTDQQLGGCDSSSEAVNLASNKIKSSNIFIDCLPTLNKKANIIICSEVIEHIKDYDQCLKWMSDNLANNGLLILTTQAGKVHNSDIYAGHVQHFTLKKLNLILDDLNFNIAKSIYWGFPFFTAQKYLTDFNFNKVQNNYLEGKITLRKKIVFKVAYLLYFLHDLIKIGPQIYIIARRK